MLNTVKVDLNRKELIKAIRAMKKKERDSFLEDLLAATSPVYLESIREARGGCRLNWKDGHCPLRKTSKTS